MTDRADADSGVRLRRFSQARFQGALLVVVLVAAALVPALSSRSAGAQGWRGFSVSELPSRVEGGDAPAWALAVTNDIGGPGVDVWNNNHTSRSEAIIDLESGGGTPRTANQFGATITFGPDSHGVAFSDIDGDGDDDLLEVTGRNNDSRLFRNNNGELREINAGNLEDFLARGRNPLFADFDGDGDMDVLVTNLDLRDDVIPEDQRAFRPSEVYLNNGNGTSWTRLADPNEVIDDGNLRLAQVTSRGPGTSSIVVTHDLFTLARDSVVLGSRTLQAAANPAVSRTDTSLPIREVLVGDFDGDLYPEFIAFAASASANSGPLPITAHEVSSAGNARTVNIPRSAALNNCRSGAAADFDNDGDLDILAGCTQFQEGQNRNVVLINDGRGNFTDAGVGLLGRTTPDTAAAVVVADINTDGWVDVIVANGNDHERGIDLELTNRGGSSAHWLGIDLVGSNPDAIGAQVFVGTDRWQVRETGHSQHRSQDSRTLHFGLGSATSVAPVHVQWPDGSFARCSVGAVDRVVRIVQGSASCTNQSRTQMLAALDVNPGAPPAPTIATCGGLRVTVDIGAGQRPTGGNDVILGTAGRDVISGLGGNDTICGLGGNDTLSGGDGVDRLIGGDGDDSLIGGIGGDRLQGGNGRDDIMGGGGWDLIIGGADADTISGRIGNDTIIGGPGSDIIDGGNGFDNIQGGLGNDRIEGGNGDDEISGDEGNDVIRGGAGDDVLEGNRGADQVFGDDGDDIVNGNFGSDALRGGAGTDRINGGQLSDVCGGGSTVNCESLF